MRHFLFFLTHLDVTVVTVEGSQVILDLAYPWCSPCNTFCITAFGP
jgi:hypothetical protein